jgi:predicted acetylornithine/succinylornithine family transaminase
MRDEARMLAGVIHHPRLVLTRGAGSWVWDEDGNRYLDFTAGLAVAALGHGRADLAAALRDQYAQLEACSNLYGNVPALELAERLVRHSFAARVWFANSGTEANEAALKFARLAARAGGSERKTQVVAFRGGFHGRTLGALALTHEPHYRVPFAPLVPGVRFAAFNDLESARRAIDARTCAVFVEPVQGEGGVVPADPDFLRGLRRLCDEHQALLVFDEVQCGLGRMGTLFAYEGYGVVPDLLTLAKPLGGGLPLGATLISESVARVLRPGQHGSTFSGGPCACAVGVRVFDAIATPAFLEGVRLQAVRLRAGLDRLAAASPLVAKARGRGLMQALVLKPAHRLLGAEIVTQARHRGLLVTRAGRDAVRLLPPLNCTSEEIDFALGVLGDALAAAQPAKRAARPLPAATEAPAAVPVS